MGSWKPSASGAGCCYDETHPLGGRIFIKQENGGRVLVCCNLEGWMEHTRFFKDTKEAEQAYRLMKPVIVSVLEKANSAKRAGRVDLAWEAISDFVARFPQ